MHQPDATAKRARRPAITLGLIILISFSFIAGVLVGAGGLFAYQQLQIPTSGALAPQQSPPTFPESGTTIHIGGQNDLTLTVTPPIDLLVPEDGIFIVDQDGSLLRLEGLPDENTVDFASLPSTTEIRPIIALKGDDLPLGNLRLIGYVAGIGANFDASQAGAIVASLQPGSPAEAAGLMPGELVTKADGLALTSVPSLMSNVADLMGPYGQTVTLEVVTGTTVRTIQVERMYRSYSVQYPFTLDRRVAFHIEAVRDYVLLYVDQALAPGTYAVEFATGQDPFGSISVHPTPTLTLPSDSFSSLKWIFAVR